MIPSDFASALMNAQDTKAKILIVDDEVVNRTLLTRILKNQHDLRDVDNAHAAFSILESEPIDLVLLDIMMPRMSGLEALEIMRKTPRMMQVPVILISALSQTGDIVSGLQLGANDYITKPIDVEVVLARVDTQLKLKRMMDLQKHAIAELEAAQHLKDHLLRIASHDLKSPLMNIHLVEMLLRDSLVDDPNSSDLLDMLQNTVYNMNGIIEEFLDMAACQDGQIELQRRAVEAAEIVPRVIEPFNLGASKKAITLAMGSLPGVTYADPSRLIQMLNNLVGNAIKYSPRETTVSVWTEVLTDSVRFHVADQGPGIPEGERDRLFKEFGKSSNIPTGNESSTGLGLWIVKHMVMLHGGTIGVVCPESGGSIFWLELPLFHAPE